MQEKTQSRWDLFLLLSLLLVILTVSGTESR